MDGQIFEIGAQVKVINLPKAFQDILRTAEEKKLSAVTPEQKETARIVGEKAKRYRKLLTLTGKVVAPGPVCGVLFTELQETMMIPRELLRRAG